MTGGRTLGFLALWALLGLAGCQRWCERYAPQTAYAPPAYGGCCAPPQPCCAPVSNYPVQAQPCAPGSGWNVPAAPR